jgi:polysaccharide export outer membrane protein
VETYRPFKIRGAVVNPGQYPYVNNMTTETAIAIAGGLKPGADNSAITVSGAAEPARAASLTTPVRPGDTIIVQQER